jgi:ABC-type transporter Mla subunit MlaD
VQSLAASPTMVGAITTLIVVVAVFLAYNANQGLPFVPVYRVSAELCNASRLGPNNEVRIGGNRIGVVESVETIELEEASGCQTAAGDSAATAAKLNLKLDESAKPIPEDSLVRVRYRSSFGLKYLEIQRGEGDGLPEGGSLPIEQAQEQTEFDDIANTFDTPTRENSRIVLEGFGNAFAARGASLNQAIESLDPLFTNLRPVARALSDPTTRLVRFFPELGDAARIVAPVAEEQAELFTNMAISFAAISSDEEALRDAISEGVPTLETGIRSLPVQRPFLRDFAEVSRLLRPGVRDLRISLPVLNSAVGIGAKTLRRTPPFNADLEDVMGQLEELVDEPSTKISIVRLGDTLDETASAAGQIGPYQTVCNYWNYWFTFLPEHFSQDNAFGKAERVLGTGAPDARNPIDSYSGGQADGRVTQFTPPRPGEFRFRTIPVLHGNPYGPSGTEEAPNCQSGQVGYAVGEALIPGQHRSNPTFGPTNIAEAAGIPPLGRTDLFIRQNGQREFWERG